MNFKHILQNKTSKGVVPLPPIRISLSLFSETVSSGCFGFANTSASSFFRLGIMICSNDSITKVDIKTIPMITIAFMLSTFSKLVIVKTFPPYLYEAFY